MPGKQSSKHLRWLPPGAGGEANFDIPAHEPPLAPRDEAVFLLHTGAEIEHALLVQYLYAAYSLKSPKEVPQEHAGKVRAWKKTLLGIAREEMGHLITVQNLLRLIGGPLNLEREDYPFRSQLYPFPFRLERLSKESLAKYVVAEMPYFADPPEELRHIVTRAATASTMVVNQVGAIYARVTQLLAAPDESREPRLADEDFLPGVRSHQAHYDNWGGEASVLVPELYDRAGALKAIAELAEQGEGLEDAQEVPSHFQRLLAIYREFPEAGEWEPTYAVPADPNTGTSDGIIVRDQAGRITHPEALQWAELFNLRYRLLLSFIAHFLQTEGPVLDANAEYTGRGYLNQWAFDEMRRMSDIAMKLAKLPREVDDPNGEESPGRAGAPFELPYTLNLPDREPDRWRTHIDVLEACLTLEQAIAASSGSADDRLLRELATEDAHAIAVARAMMRGERLPGRNTGFAKAVRLLESAVRGFRVGAHHNFWRNVTRDEFVSMSVFGYPLVSRRGDGSFDAAGSNLIKALRGEPPFDAADPSEDPSRLPRMPAEHPPMAPEAIEYIYRWIEAGCPE
ncbi:MAG: ferritin-like protein [Chloroflexota bacterium]|nr:ferritin-like protein [Chloroflexota bacterium]